MKTLSLSEAKMKLSRLASDVHQRDEEVVITRNGKPIAVLISPSEYESWQETLAIRADKALMREIRRGLKLLKGARRLYTVDEVFDDPE